MKKFFLMNFVFVTSLLSNNTIQQSSIINFTDLVKNNLNSLDLFKKEIQFDGIVIVKFFANWCGPCRRYALIFEEVSKQLQETKVNEKTICKIKYLEVEIDPHYDIANYCNVKPIPTTQIYKNGKLTEILIGLQNKTTLIEKIQKSAKSNNN